MQNQVVNPLLTMEHLALLLLLLLGLGGWLAWRSAQRAPRWVQVAVTLLRMLTVAWLGIIAFNPGRWIVKSDVEQREWALLVDQSASMAVEDVAGASRWLAARRLAGDALAQSADVQGVKLFSVGESLVSTSPEALASLGPTREGTDLPGAGLSLLGRYEAPGRRLTGIILLSDGRQVAATDHTAFAARARAQNVPLLAIALGGAVARRDLTLSPLRRQVVAFAGQTARLSATLENEGLGSIRPTVQLRSATGEKIDARQIDLPEGARRALHFDVTLDQPGYREFELSTPLWDAETIEVNNSTRIGVSVLGGSLRVLLSEGTPSWDSKFLSQLLRLQPGIEVEAVYRLSRDRFFRIEARTEDAQEVEDAVFPDSMEALAGFDMVIFGKGMEYFMTPDRMLLLHQYVRDEGGCVIFSRGRPYSGELPGLAPLEPTHWRRSGVEGLVLQPTAAGERDGLFGSLLPPRESDIWQQLPLLAQAQRCGDLRGFARVLAAGRVQGMAASASVPVLVNRRVGKGMVLLMNTDGLWHWDFSPGEAAAAMTYKELWIQLVHWAATCSEYLPGQSYALRLDRTRVLPGEPVRVMAQPRPGVTPPDGLSVSIRRGDEVVQTLPLSTSGAGERRREAFVALESPGTYCVTLSRTGGAEVASPEAVLQIQPPARESDERSADPAYLGALCSETGGRLIRPEELAGAVAELERDPDATLADGQAEWRPFWDRAWMLLGVVLLAGSEWAIRRRNGLL